MKSKFFHIMRGVLPIFLIATLAFLLMGFAPYQAPVPEAPPLAVPEWVEMLILSAITFLITQGLKSLTAAVPNLPNLQGQATAVVAALVYVIVSVANALLALVPAEYAPLVTVILTAIGGILSSYGIAGTLKALTKPKESQKPKPI